MPISIRPATKADESAVSRICLLTGEAGTSAESVYTIPELIGLVYAIPYLYMTNSFAYVLVTDTPEPPSSEKVERRTDEGPSDTSVHTPAPIVPDSPEAAGSSSVPAERVIGYIIGTTDTRAFEAELSRDWWPAQRARYPIDSTPGNENDKRLMGIFVKPDSYPQNVIEKAPAHMHINVLPEAQRSGWGRRMIDTAIKHIKEHAGGNAVFLGIDPRNDKARQFYKHVGFKFEPTAQGENYILPFDDWVPPSTKGAQA